MDPQTYALTGKRRKPDYVGVINANTPYLPRKKELADLEAYRSRTLDLETRRLKSEEQLARDALEANKKATDTSSLIGLGQLGISTYTGAERNKKLNEIIAGSGVDTGKTVAGTVAPTAPTAGTGDIGDTNPFGPSASGDSFGGGKAIGSISENAGKTDFWSGLGKGASNWGNIASSSLVGGTVGAGLGEKIFGKNTSSRVIGGAAVAGGLSYLSSGDPYTAGLSAIFGGTLGGFI